MLFANASATFTQRGSLATIGPIRVFVRPARAGEVIGPTPEDAGMTYFLFWPEPTLFPIDAWGKKQRISGGDQVGPILMDDGSSVLDESMAELRQPQSAGFPTTVSQSSFVRVT